ncbi:glucose-6-phosphate dehydrogenase [Desulfoplanes formicivorans]|nr:glucose-6-phosphate dehydrogenase [Desulfoplanes formicivorans]
MSKQATDITFSQVVSDGTNQDCMLETVKDPLILVIFGATGDLTARKVFPAVYNLMRTHTLPHPFLILGIGRSELTSSMFQHNMQAALAKTHKVDPSAWEVMARSISYLQMDYTRPQDYAKLKRTLKALDPDGRTQGNILFYLAVPPDSYALIAEQLGKAGLSREYVKGNGRISLVVEKPFGRDLESARKLDRTLHTWFEEHQIFRIDHYMAKETVQNVLMFRFANAMFEPIWNRSYIDYIEITAWESLGVEHRAGYYDRAGVLRDMFQNHMMMLLALCAMEPPSLFESERVRDERSKVYRAMQPFPVDRIDQRLVLGQYAAGIINGRPVPGYVEEPGVDPRSLTPTYARMKVFIDNWRWQGVPMFLTSGKRMAEKRTEIVIQFKEVPCSMFHRILGDHITANRLVLGIHPNECVDLTFQTKAPGTRVCLRPVNMHFDYAKGYGGPLFDDYEKILLDCMLGDQTLFWRQDAVELCWGFLTPILEECDCPDRRKTIYLYRAGTNGPQEAQRIKP